MIDQWLYKLWAEAIPPKPVASIVEWCRLHLKLPGSARSESYNPDISPWGKTPLDAPIYGLRRGTFIKPVQAGGSVVGEGLIAYALSTWSAGDVQYNWPNDTAAADRWDERVEKILKACPLLMCRTDPSRFKWMKGLVVFPHANFIMQGINTPRSVASRSIRLQVNEELHIQENGWEDGKLEQATGRLTAVWNSVQLNISNAGKEGSDLHKLFLNGTQEHWEVKCPGCGLYHRMRTRWEKEKPELGGLRYNSEGCKSENGSYNYEKLKGTIFYQMPCGYKVHDDVSERRRLSLSGRYSEPDNKSAPATERSWTLEAVSVDYIDWLGLIMQKHKALASLRRGDHEPWNVYQKERECIFTSDETRPVVNKLTLSNEVKKNREGLPNKTCRFAAGDRQRGTFSQGELPHWWLLIVDVELMPDNKIHVMVVFEGKLLTDLDLAQTIQEHKVVPTCVVLDSGWDTTNVYQVCLRNGYSAIKGEPIALFAHPSEGKKIYSVEKPLHSMVNRPPIYDYLLVNMVYVPNPFEPMFWHYSKLGAFERLEWLRSSPDIKLIIPSDVSQDFISHMGSWIRDEKEKKDSSERVTQWKQTRERDDLYVLFFLYCNFNGKGRTGWGSG